MAYEDRYKEFEQYLASGEPGVEGACARVTGRWLSACRMLTGWSRRSFCLNRLKLISRARFRARRSASDLRSIIARNRFEKAEVNGTFEADRVADRINLLLAEKAFTFSPMELSRIHGFLFQRRFASCRTVRTYNITKVSGFLTVIQSAMAARTLCRNFWITTFSEERKFNYSTVSSADAIKHIVAIHFQASGRFTLSAKVTLAQLRYFLSSISRKFRLRGEQWEFWKALMVLPQCSRPFTIREYPQRHSPDIRAIGAIHELRRFQYSRRPPQSHFAHPLGWRLNLKAMSLNIKMTFWKHHYLHCFHWKGNGCNTTDSGQSKHIHYGHSSQHSPLQKVQSTA